MHEFSVVRSLLTQIERIVSGEELVGRVTEVGVQVGEFSGVDPELLGLAFEQLAPSSSAARYARLTVRRVPLQARCEGCVRTFDVVDFRFFCPECRRPDVTIVAGEELVLESVTLEDEP
ncbi:MAG: hydrogenase maturation nickel metallochaperone HypA [Planctomycetales bacterium]